MGWGGEGRREERRHEKENRKKEPSTKFNVSSFLSILK